MPFQHFDDIDPDSEQYQALVKLIQSYCDKPRKKKKRSKKRLLYLLMKIIVTNKEPTIYTLEKKSQLSSISLKRHLNILLSDNIIYTRRVPRTKKLSKKGHKTVYFLTQEGIELFNATSKEFLV